ncbi:MAG TPA: ATP-binding protein [Planctomycetota bacterium]|nr:ATP-binding protein [Planctomycetota bacterium]
MSEPLRCLVLAPTGDDAALIAEALAGAGLAPHACADVGMLCAEIPAGAGAVVIGVEALGNGAVADITAALARDPLWSLLPFVLLTSVDTPAHLDEAVDNLFGARASVALVERPCRVATLTSVVRTALHARRRQYEIEALLRRLDAQAQDLVRSNDDLHRFASVASHDLQEPLRSITSYLAILERQYADKLDARAHEYFRNVMDGAGRMRGLILALLEYGQVGHATPEMRTFSSEEAVGAAIHNLSALIEDSRASIRISGMPTITADRTLIVQLFQNLIGNAIKYRSAAPRIEVSGDDRDREWVFTVADNGIGISRENLERIFEAFQRLHTRTEYAGYGIGLATCRRIADIHGGRIWVESTLGAGSRFFFSIPKPAVR